MTRGDALLSRCNVRREGIWGAFTEEVRKLRDDRIRTWPLARVIAANALIEFDWLKGASWVTLPTNFIRTPAPRSRDEYLAVGLLERDLAVRLQGAGIRIVSEEQPLVDGLTFTRSWLYGDIPGAIESLELHQDNRLYFDYHDYHTPPAIRILESLPPIWQSIRCSPSVHASNIEHSDDVAVFDPEQLAFVPLDNSSIDDLATFDGCVRAGRRFEMARYYYLLNGEIKRVEREIGMCQALTSTGTPYLVVSENAFAVSSLAPLPVLIERVLYLCGATAAYDSGWRLYSPVPKNIGEIIAYKLGTHLLTGAN